MHWHDRLAQGLLLLCCAALALFLIGPLLMIFVKSVQDKDGAFIKHWGSTGTEPGQFRGVKALAIDAQGDVYVADAGNKRIQVFDSEGAFKRQFANVGTPLAMCLTRGATQFLYVSHSGDPDGMEDAAIYKVRLDGTVVGKFGTAGKLPKLRRVAEYLAQEYRRVSDHTNWEMAARSLTGCVQAIEEILAAVKMDQGTAS